MPAVRILCFAGARDVVGRAELELELAATPVSAAAVMDELCRRFPGLGPYRRAIRLAVNGTYASAEQQVQAGDEVALIPPVAGG